MNNEMYMSNVLEASESRREDKTFNQLSIFATLA